MGCSENVCFQVEHITLTLDCVLHIYQMKAHNVRNPFPAKLKYFNIQPLEVVSR